jgi:hypothetical protein
MNLALVLLPALFLGLFLATHVALSAAFFAEPPRWRALVALLVPPLAPYWGFSTKRKALSVLWLAFFVAYALTLAAASAG